MQWVEVRVAYPEQWLVIEVQQTAEVDGHRRVERLLVVETASDGRVAMKRCGVLQRAHPEREYAFVHTSKVVLEIDERWLVGVRWHRALTSAA